MKKFISILLAIFSAASAEAANINKGNIEASGSFSLSKSSGWSGGYENAHSTSLFINGTGQYFFLDHFSAGLDASWATYSRGSSVSLGPVATYYFLVKENIAPFLMLAPLSWSKHSGNSIGDLSSTIRLGAKFFLTDSLAFGPALQYQWVHASRGRSDFGNCSFLGEFSIHL